MATRHKVKYIELSAILNHRVDELLVGIVRQIRLRPERGSLEVTPFCSTGSYDPCRCLPPAAYDFLCGLMRKDDNTAKSCENLLAL